MERKISILVLTSWGYGEPLMHSYVLPNLEIILKILPEGSKIFLQTSEKKSHSISAEEKAKIHRLLSKKNIQWLPMSYSNFGLIALLKYFFQIVYLTFLVWRKGIKILHPFAASAGTTALFISFFTRNKIVLDSWEPHAESMVETGTWRKSSAAFKLLWWSEKKIARRAHVLIAASKAMVKYAEEKYGYKPKKVFFRPACVNLQLFDPAIFDKQKIRQKLNLEGKIICVCASKLGGLYLGVETFQFFKFGLEIFDNFHVLLLSETPSSVVTNYCETTGFPKEHINQLSINFTEVPMYLAAADFAFNPQQPVPSKRFGTPVKDGEYWAMGLPIVILPEISEDSEIVRTENVGIILQDLQPKSMMAAMLAMKNLLAENNDLSVRSRAVAERYRNYSIAEDVYNKIYNPASI